MSNKNRSSLLVSMLALAGTHLMLTFGQNAVAAERVTNGTTNTWETKFYYLGVDDETKENTVIKESETFSLDDNQFSAALALATGFCNPDFTDYNLESDLYEMLPQALVDLDSDLKPFN